MAQSNSKEVFSPLLTFGVVTDVQYADVENGYNFNRTRRRFYRCSLEHLKAAMQAWKNSHNKLSFILQLGDLIDGKNKTIGASKSALNITLDTMEKYEIPIHHMIGNHDLYNFHKNELGETSLRSNPDRSELDVFYYTFTPIQKLKVVILDSYDLSLIGNETDSDSYLQALDIVKSVNKNSNLNSIDGLKGPEERFAEFNGGFSQRQIEWLDGVLREATEQNDNVLVCGHLPIHANSSDYSCLAWNCTEILTVMHCYSCIAAYFCGHNHDGGYVCDHHGIHHVNFPAILETSPDSNAFATVELYADRMHINGFGRVKDLTIRLRHTV